MRYKIVALLLLCVCSCFAQQQYSTTKVWGLSALDSKMSTTNLWYPFPSGVCNSPSMGFDNVFYCTGGGAAGTVWYWDKPSQTWKQITAVGSGWTGIAAINSGSIYLLKSTNGAVYHWDGTNLTQPNPANGYVDKIAVASDGTLVGTDLTYLGGSIWKSTNGGVTWTRADPNSGWSQAMALDTDTMCGVKNGVINMYNTSIGAFVPMSPLPPAAVSVYTCNISNDPSEGLTLFSMYKTTNNHGQYINAVAKYDFTSNTWTAVVTPTAPVALTSISKWQTMMLDSSGRVYHFNVAGIMYTVTTSGTGPNCPGLNGCPPNTHHAQTLCVSLPGGMNGGCGTQSVVPTTNLYNSRYDVTATGCDALFGDLGACVPVESGDVICSATNQDLGGPGDVIDPVRGWSENVAQWDEYFLPQPSLASTGEFLGYPWWKVPTRIGITKNACRGGTYAACSGPYGQTDIGKIGVCWGSNCTAALAIQTAKNNAIARSPGNWLAYGIFYLWTEVNGGAISCDLITFWDDARAGVDPCY